MRTKGRVKRVIRLGDDCRVVLYAWSHEEAPRIENVVCEDASGEAIWHARLPSSAAVSDCFVSLAADASGIVVRTFSGILMRLCPVTGQSLEAPLAA